MFPICKGPAQGFVNLDFESAEIVYDGYLLSVSNAFPGWAVTAPYITYDSPSLSGASISITDSNGYPPYPVQGDYFVFLASANYAPTATTISLGQTGAIPSWAQTITFWGTVGGMQVSFDGNPLYFAAIGTGPNHTIYGADISAYANQSGELIFTLPPYVANATLDNIQFSSTPVPEPTALTLFCLGLVGLLWREHQNQLRLFN